MTNFSEILQKNLYGVIATQDGKKVKTRVFQYLFTVNNKFYFGTTNNKPVYEQLQANPYVSYCTFSSDFSPVLSLNGKAVFVNDMKLKTRAMDDYPAIKDLYKSPDNPIFEIFYIDVDEIVTFSFQDGQKIYTFDK